jgi:hypothetical protein
MPWWMLPRLMHGISYFGAEIELTNTVWGSIERCPMNLRGS